jgi:hypothetical protein
MATVITAHPVLDRAQYTTGDTITVTIPDADAVSTNDEVQHLTISLTAGDGTVQTLNADVPVTEVKHLPVGITGVTLDGASGTVTADGLSATVTAA